DSRYTVTDLDKPDSRSEATGRELMDHGITVEIPNRPGAGVITYKIITN
ncbi:MAG: hypothetical protein HZB26_03470, partial [Candidatus Hydrogenedentes bacterium]|nr:hypothetical protein [Candidatus Hydrogenedentota bacterium]